VNRLDCLQLLAGRYDAQTYLEIGVRTGETFLEVRVPRKIGVDPVRLGRRARLRSVGRYPQNLRARVFAETSDEFFARRAAAVFGRSRIDLAFVDGKHTHEQALRDVTNTLEFVSRRGVVVVHDVNPASAEQAWPADSPQDASRALGEGPAEAWCGDVWKVVIHLRAARPDIGVMTIGDDHGLAVINPRLRSERLGVDERDVPALSYDDLDRHRTEWLRLGTADDLAAWLAGDLAIAG
jgi:hypothetical protein